MSLETSKWEPTLDENIDMKFGKEPIEKTEQISNSLLTPDISGKDESANNMIEALKSRYGK